MLAVNEIRSRVTTVLVESLSVDEKEVTPAATLQGDLGAESIDFLDILFRLERAFGLKIPRGELFPDSIFRGDPEFVEGGRVTDRGLAELRARMPYAELSGLPRDLRLEAVPDLFTVELVTRYIGWKLGGGKLADGKGQVSDPAAQGNGDQAGGRG
jgi:acyl carrier protein